MDLLLIDGDKAIFQPAFGPATVVARPGVLQASGPATLGGKKLCVDGDEKRVEVPGCVYLTPVFSIPGTGTLKIAALAPNQKAQKTRSGGKPVLLKGGPFMAEFKVQNPAKQPPTAPGAPPTPDPTPQYSGTGQFVTTNVKFHGT